MWNKLIFVIPWLLAAGIGYCFVGTLGGKLKKESPDLYESVKNDKDSIQGIIDDEDRTKKELEEKLKGIVENSEELEEDELKTKNETEKLIQESQVKIDYLKVIKDKGLESWDWSIGNIIWVIIAFLVSGIILHFLTKFLASWIFEKKE